MKTFSQPSVLHVGSCEVERSFSTMRRVRNHLRSTMGEERLSSLILMSIHNNVVVLELVEEFVKLNNLILIWSNGTSAHMGHFSA